MGAPGVDEVRWLLPIRPDDELTLRATVLDTRTSKSRPDMGFVRFEFELFNAGGERVMTLTTSLMLGRRGGAGRVMKFWEDIAVGERAELGRHTFTADDIKAFARRFDPQPFHLDEAAAARSHFGALCASGWHTASVWMRLMVEHQRREDEARRARGEAGRHAWAVAGLSRVEMAQAGLCRRHRHLFDRGASKSALPTAGPIGV